ncbi:helix-turn-helix domain-containing protein [Croceicoccus sp. YJ47]|uniref:helix-turn-helix domain-containing protein n=1 Tax=Croceicoccus sp. YJ47 TaxID=2798724 RepID=UPI001923922C|nr:helix-turn-helix domain-containing protein [Croceicoccus sp. YJ47]QQN73534.1 helix-turn-helix domain-containing protein [Croceicoccus sp. YJ47]
MASSAVPSFYLYGEPPRKADANFVHIEALVDRSRPSEWTIQPHSHRDLHQIFILETGFSAISIEDETHRIAAPALLLVPATVVHGFAWEEDSRGWVASVARSYFDRLVQPHGELRALFARSRIVPLDSRLRAMVIALAGELRRELGWSAIGDRAATEALTLQLLVQCTRSVAADRTGISVAPSRAAELVARYRELVERRFAFREPVAAHAAALHVSESALRDACARVAGKSPARIQDDRSLLEAKRLLIYSHLSIAEVGYALGFADPAYFSRFFRRNEGDTPSRFRTRSHERQA